MSSIVEQKLALKLAKKYCPVIYQEFTSTLDIITAMDFLDPCTFTSRWFELINNPTLYFSIREDSSYYYAYYLIYHPFDWSSNKLSLIRRLDSHRHDTEAVLFRTLREGGLIDSITICHKRFFYQSQTDRRICIEAESHCIRPYSQRKPRGSYIVYKHDKRGFIHFVNLNELVKTEWEDILSGLKGRDTPMTQKDSAMTSSSSGRLKNKPGDIFKRPEVVFKSAKMKGWL